MTALWMVAMAGLLMAVLALAYARRMARRVAILEEQYWQLKFDHGELKAKVDPASPPGPESKQSFIPLTQLKR